jgi:hypothetical protein
MSLRCWLHKYSIAGVAVPAILLLLFFSSQNASTERAEPSPSAQVADPTQVGQPKKYRSPCGDTDDHSQADLCEQKRMSAAADRAADYGFWQLIIGGAGLVAVALSLVFAGIAAFAARDAAVVAAEGAEHVKRVDRAYVKMSHVSDRKGPDGSTIDALTIAGGRASVRIRVTNHGNTPADVTDAFVQSWLGPLPAMPNYRRPESRTDRQGFLTREDHFNFTEVLEHAPAPRQEFFVFGYVTYRDRFGVTHYGGYARRYLRGSSGNNLGFVDNPIYNFDSETLPGQPRQQPAREPTRWQALWQRLHKRTA